MNTSSRLKILGWSLLVLWFSTSQDARAQYISSDENRGTYLNYAGRNYENYSTGLLRRKFFDGFGNFLVDGVTVYGLEDEQRPSTSFLDNPTSSLSKTRFYSSYFSNLVIMNDSYSGLSSRLMIGDAIRTKFTSLTLDKARFNGIRWDASTPKYRATVLSSRVSDPLRMDPDNVLTSRQQVLRIREWTTYLLGGHFETDLGDVLTVGLTYVNQHQRRTNAASGGSDLRGIPANAVPRVIFVTVRDDSPGDNSGPWIFQAPQIIINGQPLPMINIYNRVPDAFRSTIRDPIQYWVFRDYAPLYVATYPARDTVSQTDHVFYKQRSAAVQPFTYPVQLPSDRIEVNYNMTFAYVIPPEVTSVEFSAVLSNDYRIDASHDWINNVNEYTEAPYRSHADSVVAGNLAVPTPFRTLLRAEGNVKDGSNKRAVRFSYGLTTGMATYGLNFAFKWNGFDIEGEYANMIEYAKYPINPGMRFDRSNEAFYIRGTKRVGRVTFGAERYRIAPGFTGRLDMYTMDNSFYGDQNTPVRPDQTSFDADASFDPTQSLPGQYIPGRAGGAVYSLIDDNDDNDRWEDGFYHYNVRAYPNLLNGDVANFNYLINYPGFGDPFLMGYRQNANELIGVSDIIRKPDAGIFPGRDKDRDGVPDDDRNSDGVPDYEQDFLTYVIDKPFFIYGDDWNNNSVIDEQENDILPDMPYNPDLNGSHVFASVELLRAMNLKVGRIREQAIAHGGKNYSDYVKWTYESGTPRFGHINLFFVRKRVEDNIPNNGYQFTSALTIFSSIPTFTFDPMEYRNSLVHQMYLGTLLTQIPNLRIENNIRFENNDRYAIGAGLRDTRGKFLNPEHQKDGRITKLGVVNKIDYTIRLLNNRILISPQFKVRTQKTVLNDELPTGLRSSTVTEHIQEIMPILRVDYGLTDRTYLRLGFQGLTIPGVGEGLAYQIRNLRLPMYDEERRTSAVTITNRSSYGGYNVVIDLGYKFTSREFPRLRDPKLRHRNESLIFVTVYAGF
jgi:hypothetical protein